jgi:hypothetical protein
MRGRGGGVAGFQPTSTAVHNTTHGAQINFGDLTPYLTYGRKQGAVNMKRRPLPAMQDFDHDGWLCTFTI